MSKVDLREQMPQTAAFIDQLREVFSKDAVNMQIRKGLQGEAAFYASENGCELGTRNKRARCLVAWDDKGRSFSVDIPAGASFGDERRLLEQAREKANARGQ